MGIRSTERLKVNSEAEEQHSYQEIIMNLSEANSERCKDKKESGEQTKNNNWQTKNKLETQLEATKQLTEKSEEWLEETNDQLEKTEE